MLLNTIKQQGEKAEKAYGEIKAQMVAKQGMEKTSEKWSVDMGTLFTKIEGAENRIGKAEENLSKELKNNVNQIEQNDYQLREEIDELRGGVNKAHVRISEATEKLETVT